MSPTFFDFSSFPSSEAVVSTNISYMPTDGLCYDPAEPTYWDKEALQKEVVRIFEICHGCRMCFKYCDSFFE